MSAKLKALILKTIPQTGRNLALACGKMEEHHLSYMENMDVHGFLKWAFSDWDERGFASETDLDQRWEEWINYKPKKRPISTVFGKSMSRADNKPLTMGRLYDILTQLKSDPNMTMDIWENKVVVSSDEKGNGMMFLQAVEISKTGVATMWPGITK